VFAYVNTKTTPLEIHFIYLDKKEIYCIFETCCMFVFYFPQNSVYLIILSFSAQIILMLFTSHMLKFKYQPHPVNVNAYLRDNS